VKTIKVVKEEDGLLKPTHTAILFFSDNPQEFIPQSSLKMARFRGNTRIEFLDSREIFGPFYKMLDEMEIFFKRNTRLASKIVEFKRVDIPEYPFEAIREAVVNALAHRDYLREGANVQIDIFDDRIEVTSPGGLLPGLNIKKLEGSHETRNTNICEIFHETKDMERFGTGVKKMKNYMESHRLKPPEFSEPGDFFRVTFYGPQDKILDLVPSIPEERQTDLKKLGLNERQIEALRMMLNEGKVMTNREYRKSFSVTNKTASTDLSGLVKFDMAKFEGKGRNVRYFAK
jgi:ATP-dependent DNA helicase RecG